MRRAAVSVRSPQHARPPFPEPLILPRPPRHLRTRHICTSHTHVTHVTHVARHTSHTSHSAPVVFLALVFDFAFVVAIGGFLAMHYNLIAHGCTSIDMYEKERIHPWPYNRGWRRNMEEVFGKG